MKPTTISTTDTIKKHIRRFPAGSSVVKGSEEVADLRIPRNDSVNVDKFTKLIKRLGLHCKHITITGYHLITVWSDAIERKRVAKAIADNALSFKVCCGCGSILLLEFPICNGCHSFRFETDPMVVAKTAIEVGSRERNSASL